MKVTKLDHLVITVRNLDRTMAFYTRVLGMEQVTFADGRKALKFGDQKINLHPAERKFAPHAENPVPGSADICFITETPMEAIISHMGFCNVPVIAGPLKKTGATGPLLSIYIRDPDGCLIEIANQVNEEKQKHALS